MSVKTRNENKQSLCRELSAAGHHVLGMARSDAAAASITSAGAEVYRGSLDDLDSLRSGAAESDGVVHSIYNPLFRICEICKNLKSKTKRQYFP